jgi:ATP-dependent DNA helicase DinG
MGTRLPAPAVFGLPPRFDEWRKGQDRACESMADPDPRFLIQNCPTGFGKSLTYLTASQLIEGRTVILTSTKGLQSQLSREFGTVEGVIDIRGRGNYPCRLNTKVTCDLGICAFGAKCSLREEGGCTYYDLLRRAKRSKVVITNYAYWMSQCEFSSGLGDFEMLVLDEAHAAPGHVIDHIGVQFSKKYKFEADRLGLKGQLPNSHASWVRWAEEGLVQLRWEHDRAVDNRKNKLVLQLRRLMGKLERVESMGSDWIWEDGPVTLELTPTWPAPYAEPFLFLGTPKVVLTSATVVPKTASLLGIPAKHAKFEDFPSSFPLENRRVTHLPTVRMNYRITELENRLWIGKIDNIIKPRLSTKGIIHTVSYARRDLVLEKSRYRDHMITHDRKDTESTVQNFKLSDPPLILVSPSMATGWDFPGDDCRWQILPKLPYPDTRGEIMKKRSKADPDYTAYIVMQLLIQAAGRGVRSEEDWCECFILDNNVQWFIEKNRHLNVNWFRGAYQQKAVIPKPLTEG